MKRLILIRHGQSIWNAENKFTGWVDSPLSDRGIQEAIKAGKLIKEFNIDIEGAFTSFLSRAIDTLNLLLKELNKSNLIVNKTWYLNERHYGSLTGLNKEETKQKIGESLFLKYRRSWDIAPPPMEKYNKNISLFGSLNKSIPENKVPNTESLKNTYNRVIKYYNQTISDILKKNNVVIIAAHGNSLRALCKYLFKISDEEINSLEIPTGNPMIINFLDNLKIDNATYLDKERAKPINNLD
ncbi:2,3-diphosphoglycerate-dependent phosphoglycerate mutase [Alphaproteobacteria bacterium]|nr:2,3-diphosphoglycerate-dependent phosphoglycerate mutase [Alphaproteobacteria bacterium]